MPGKIEGKGGEGAAGEEVVGWCHRLSEHELSKLLEIVKDREACSPWSHNNGSFNPYDSPGKEVLLVFPLC